MMELISINVGGVQPLRVGEREVASAIHKQPVGGRVRAGRLGLDGDAQADGENHGGPYQALLACPGEHYGYWAERLNAPARGWGEFGENLTTWGVLETDICVGDVWRAGEALVQVVKPRRPCFKWAGVMGVREFVVLVLQSGRTGCYLRVLEDGEVGAGSPLELVRRDAAGVSLPEMLRIMTGDGGDVELLRRALGIDGLTEGIRGKIEAALR